MSESQHLAVVRNRDNDQLGPMRGKTLLVGYVEEANGLGAMEIPGFIATKHELITLVKYWERRSLAHEFFWFVYSHVSSCEMREKYFATTDWHS